MIAKRVLVTGGFGFHYGAERLGAMVIPTGAGRTALQLTLMRDLGATVVTAIATYPLRLLEVAREERFDLGTLALRVGIFGSEIWSDELRARIERELRIRTFDIIGMTETGGPGLGIDCAARAGIHVWEDHFFVEIVDPATGAPRPDGAEGELVVSTLTRAGLPLVRYRTHDLTRVVARARYLLPQQRLSPAEETDALLCPERPTDDELTAGFVQEQPCRGAPGALRFDVGAHLDVGDFRVDALLENLLDQQGALRGEPIGFGGTAGRVLLTLRL